MLIQDKQIYERIAKWTDDWNNAQSSAATRITKSRYAAARAVTNLYIKATRTAVASPQWADSDVLPVVYTNRTELSRLVKCCPKSTYNHLEILIGAGVVQKTLHGNYNDFELTMHPYFVFGDGYEMPILADLKRKKTTLKTTLPPLPEKNLPHISSPEARESNIIYTNSGVNSVDLWVSPNFRPNLPQNPLASVDNSGENKRTTQEDTTAETNLEAQTQDRRNTGGAAGGFDRTPYRTAGQRAKEALGINDTTTEDGPHSSELRTATGAAIAEHNRKKAFCENFWQYARPMLYPELYPSEKYEKQILNLIWKDVFGSFNNLTEGQVASLYTSRMAQVDIAVAYAKKHDWSSFLPPPLFFSREQFKSEKANNKRGSFFWTAEWVDKQNERRRTQIEGDTLAKAITSILTKKPPRGLKGSAAMSNLALYQYWHKRLSKFGKPDLLVKFNEKTLKYYVPTT